MIDFFKTAIDYGKSAISAVGSFLGSDTAKTIGSGATTILQVMKEGADRADLQNFQPQGLVNPQTTLPGRMGGASRSMAGRASFGDISEATYYKYAALQNTIRYLYNTKANYKRIARDRS